VLKNQAALASYSVVLGPFRAWLQLLWDMLCVIWLDCF